MVIKLSSGEAKIKDVYTRKIAKRVNEILFKNSAIKNDIEDKKLKQSISGMKILSTDEANDYVLCEMIEELTINGKIIPISIEALDNLPAKDFDLIKREIDKVAGIADEKKN